MDNTAKTFFYTGLILISFLFISSKPISNDQNDYLVKLNDLELGNNWKLIDHKEESANGYIAFEDSKWMMNFIHWWPLDESRSEINVDKVKELLQTLWGSMSFDLTGVQGETMVNGHRAFYVEGKLREVVLTRFVLWNCEESNRQFLADCNINILRQTPEYFFEIQKTEMLNGIACHNQHIKTKLKQVDHKDLSVSVSIPENWRSNPFIIKENSYVNSPGHYQEGISSQKGTLWNLNTESQRMVELYWGDSSEVKSKKEFKKLLLSRFKLSKLIKGGSKDRIRINAVINKIKSNENLLSAFGSYDLIIDYGNSKDTVEYIYKAHFWNEKDRSRMLINSMAAHKHFWKIPVDLKPSNSQFKSFDEKVTAIFKDK